MKWLSRQKAVFYITVVLLAGALACYANAQLAKPQATFIPDQLSAGSSFAMVVDPGNVEGSARITWVSGEGYGLFPFIDGKYMCYFSDTDSSSICGPSPFKLPTTEGYPYLMDINVVDSEGNQENTSINVEVGGLKLDPRITITGDGKAIMVVYVIGGVADSVTYRVYDSSFTPVTPAYYPLSLIPENLAFNGSVRLGVGIYYIAFKAESPDDFGGGIIRVNTGGETHNPSQGMVDAEPLNIEMFVDQGNKPHISVNKRITNLVNQTFAGVSVELPATSPVNIRDYIRISLSDSTLLPKGSVYYNVSFIRPVDAGMDINANAEIRASGSVIGTIPISIKLSVRGSSSVDCSTLSDGSKCLGGICCNGVCREAAECCSDIDCTPGTCQNYRCVTGSASCTEGTCRSSCFSSESETGESCTLGTYSGVCCIPSNECAGMPDSSACSEGVCCSEKCVECCDKSDCDEGEECSLNICIPSVPENTENPAGTIFIILLVVIAAGVGAWWYFAKYRKRSSEEEFEKEEDTFDEEEFY